ncbi:MAG TPA: Crp/Fnr family transcriptional regulator [Anaerolineales bacterium]|nr:Crp/Fnr family transcriptional regulator [Anaerolineales bacterium]
MVSPEILRRFPFFALFSHEQLKTLAMSGEEIQFEDQETILSEGETAHELYFLLEGCVDLFYVVQDAFSSQERQEVPVSQITPGEPFGISSLIEPYVLTSTARGCHTCKVIRFDAHELRKAFNDDKQLELLFLRKAAKAAIERLHSTRIQLAAAWS